MKKKVIVGILIMCSMVQLTVPNMQLSAESKSAREAEVLSEAVDRALNDNLTMEEAAEGLSKKDERDDDGDGLVNYWEDSIETDKNNPDTDGDGLTDYEEVVLTGTDPLLVDTDEDGISDADADSDGDGLTNKEEIELGTNPLSIDTDEDGLTDWEEVNVYGTDPNVYDTDLDGASDGLEVEKMQDDVEGFEPLSFNEEMEELLQEETALEETQASIALLELDEDVDNTTLDSDGDGIPDAEDSAPYERGLEGGIVGSLQIVGSHNTDALFSEGHSFLVYTSYVDGQTVTIDDLYGYHNFNKADYAQAVAENEQLLSWRELVEACTIENESVRKEAADSMWPKQDSSVESYTLDRGDYLSIGNFTQNSYMKSLNDGFLYGQSGTMLEMAALQALFEAATGKKVDVMYIMTHLSSVMKKVAKKSYISGEDVVNGKTNGGIWINREMYDQRYQYDQYPHEIYQVDITQAEYNKMMESLNSNNYYSMLNHNCSSVASVVWNATVGYQADENGNYVTDKKGNRIKSDLYISARGKGILSILDFPGAVCENILKIKEKGATRGKYYSDNSKIVQGGTISSSNGNIGGSGTTGGSDQSGTVTDKPATPSDSEDSTGAGETNQGSSSSGNVSSGNTSSGNSSTGASASGNSSAKPSGGIISGFFGFVGSIFSSIFGW